ncbi:hypothetical protein [Wenjunlia vitaminophila]|uniref:hypothetical protein n=1 Tax=Wenjunlia vitaminophila TaxID=76728 RepID=UPI000364CF83|nr:hypothetical protein [Wenjunlia vitaminophila]
MEVLGSFPATPEGREQAEALQAKLARDLVRRGLGKKFGVGVTQRGTSYWVTLHRR